MANKPHRRAYVNPFSEYPEKEQRSDILEHGPVNEWYVEGRTIKREDFIRHLRPGDEAVVAQSGCLAKATGRIDSRMTDLSEARGDIHARGCVVIDLMNDLRSDRDWLAMKANARSLILALRSIKNGSARRYEFTNAELKTMLRIQDSRRYKNDNQRQVAIEKEGIKPAPKRTWRIEKLPVIARERGIEL